MKKRSQGSPKAPQETKEHDKYAALARMVRECKTEEEAAGVLRRAFDMAYAKQFEAVRAVGSLALKGVSKLFALTPPRASLEAEEKASCGCKSLEYLTHARRIRGGHHEKECDMWHAEKAVTT